MSSSASPTNRYISDKLMSNVKYPDLYSDFAKYPEGAAFPRMIEEQFWRLHILLCDYEEKEKLLSNALRQSSRGAEETSPTDWQCLYDSPHHDLIPEFVAWHKSLDTYSHAFCVLHDMIKLPPPHPYFTDWFHETSPQYVENGIYKPTGSLASLYGSKGGEPDKDLAVLRALPDLDPTTNWLIKRLKRTYNFFFGKPGQTSTVKLETIATILSCVTCGSFVLLLTLSLFILTRMHTMDGRIAVIGTVAFLIVVLMFMFEGRRSRIEVCALAAAWFAVASVFVGATSSSYPFESLN